MRRALEEVAGVYVSVLHLQQRNVNRPNDPTFISLWDQRLKNC